MEIIFLLIGIGLIVALGFLAAYFWASKKGQFKDQYTPAIRILFEDGEIKSKEKDKTYN